MDLKPSDFFETPAHLFPVPRRTLAVLMAIAEDFFEAMDETARRMPRTPSFAQAMVLSPMANYREQMLETSLIQVVWQLFQDMTPEDRMELAKEGRRIIATEPEFVTRKWQFGNAMCRVRRGRPSAEEPEETDED
jgi:hypothetical protein